MRRTQRIIIGTVLIIILIYGTIRVIIKTIIHTDGSARSIQCVLDRGIVLVRNTQLKRTRHDQTATIVRPLLIIGRTRGRELDRGIAVRVRDRKDHIIIAGIELTICIAHSEVHMDRLARLRYSIILERDRGLTILSTRCDRNRSICERCIVPVLGPILGTRDLVLTIGRGPAGVRIDQGNDLILRCVTNTITSIIVKIHPHRVALIILRCRWAQIRKTKVRRIIIVRDRPGIVRRMGRVSGRCPICWRKRHDDRLVRLIYNIMIDSERERSRGNTRGERERPRRE